MRQEVEIVQEFAEALIVLSRREGFTMRELQGLAPRGWALAKQGRSDEGIAQIRESLAITEATGARLFRSSYLAMLAEAYGEAGQPEEGLTALGEALDLVSKTGYVVSEPGLHRLKGVLLLMQDESNAALAECCFLRAIEIARKQSSKFWELGATMGLARLLARLGRRDEARPMLAKIYSWFSEGFNTGDLRQAKQLLDELQ